MTRIEWVRNPDGSPGEAWNPVTGCSKVSPGCKHCYAERFAKRLRGRAGYPSDEPFRVTLHPERLDEPMRWRKPRRVFVNSMSDLFHEQVPIEFIVAVFRIMAAARHHTFLVLTKRAERLPDIMAKVRHGLSVIYRKEVWPEVHSPGWPLPNVWLGVSAENQRYADERIPRLMETPAAVRFVSLEPLLGPVDLCHIQADPWTRLNALEGCGIDLRGHVQSVPNVTCPKLDWVIVGSESGPGARPMDEAWVRALRDQCVAAGVPFYYKQRLDERGRKVSLPVFDGRTWDELPKSEVPS